MFKVVFCSFVLLFLSVNNVQAKLTLDQAVQLVKEEKVFADLLLVKVRQQFAQSVALSGISLQTKLNPRIEPVFPVNANPLLHTIRKQRQSKFAFDRFYYLSFPQALNAAEARELLTELYQDPRVEYAYFEPKFSNAFVRSHSVKREREFTAAEVEDFEEQQFYLEAAPQGVDARFAWTIPGGAGESMRVMDLEVGYNKDHREFKEAYWSNVFHTSLTDHGTAVLGEMIAANDGIGVTGIVHQADFAFSAVEWKGSFEDWERNTLPRALQLAIENLAPGDVLVIEQHGPGPNSRAFTAVEYYDAIFELIKSATDMGIFVVAAAGNGYSNLDDADYQGAFDPTVRDSGAILVGAAGSPKGNRHLKRLSFSNYGQRVDAFAYGEHVVTAGYGDLYSTSDINSDYTRNFGGTSSATPIVAGAVVSVLGMAKAAGISLSPEQVRDAIRKSGTAQTGDLAENIGNMPDIRELYEILIQESL